MSAHALKPSTDRPYTMMQELRQALDNPFVAEQERVLDFRHAEHGTIRGVASPVRLDNGDRQPQQAAPGLGEHTDLVLEELGYTDDSIRALRRQAVMA
ncbi:MAG: CoA transferase [Hyphomicrobiales bacterium]|nr:CoA transferase [Hyphomicrobiales bacterium]